MNKHIKYWIMTDKKKCSRCKLEIDVSFFGVNKKKEQYKTCDNCRNKNSPSSIIRQVERLNITRTQNIHDVERINKSKIQETLDYIANNNNNITEDCCPTCYRENANEYMVGLPPDCGLCYKIVCSRCGIYDNLNVYEANGFYCVYCYKPSLVHIDE